MTMGAAVSSRRGRAAEAGISVPILMYHQVTPSPLPTVVRVGIGVLAEALFLTYIVYFGRRAVRAGETGDLEDAPDVVPTS